MTKNDQHCTVCTLVEDNQDEALFVTNNLFGVPLYGFYILRIEKFEAGDVKGMLMDIPIQFDGPYLTFGEAESIVLEHIDEDYEA